MPSPPRPSRRDAKGDWQRWAFDSLIALRPQAGAGVLTNLLSESHRRLLRQHARGRSEEEEGDEPEIVGFAFSTNRWGPYDLGTSVVSMSIFDAHLQALPQYEQFWVMVGYGHVNFPGVLTPPGIPLPGTFRFTSPFRSASVRIVARTGAAWCNPVPDILAPGQSVDFNAPQYAGVGSFAWSVQRI